MSYKSEEAHILASKFVGFRPLTLLKGERKKFSKT